MPSELFWNSVLITASGLFLAILAVCYKSKCRTVRGCGCEIDRNVEIEEKYDEIELQNNNQNNNENNNNNNLHRI